MALEKEIRRGGRLADLRERRTHRFSRRTGGKKSVTPVLLFRADKTCGLGCSGKENETCSLTHCGEKRSNYLFASLSCCIHVAICAEIDPMGVVDPGVFIELDWRAVYVKCSHFSKLDSSLTCRRVI